MSPPSQMISKPKFPYEIVDVDPETNAKLKTYFHGQKDGFVQVGSEKWFFPKEYEENATHYYNVQPRPDDIWIVTYPRSGTTMNQEILWLLANNLDYKTAAKVHLTTRFFFLDYSILFHRTVTKLFAKENQDCQERLALLKMVTTPAWQFLEATTERRFIKTHLPLQLLPPNLLEVGCKVVCVARNPKDVAVSYYHLYSQFRPLDFQGDFSTFWDYFENDMIVSSPFWSHVQQAWQARKNKNLLFMFYEDEVKDLRGSLKKIGKFLEVNYTDEQYAKLEDHIKIYNFRKNNAVNLSEFKELGIFRRDGPGFVRQGRTGGWKDYFVGDLNTRADKWIEEKLKKTDLRFPDTGISCSQTVSRLKF